MTPETIDNKLVFTCKSANIKLINQDDKLYRIRFFNIDDLSSEEQENFLSDFVRYSKENKFEFITEENTETDSWLKKLNFQVYRTKLLYKKDLTENVQTNSKLNYKSIAEVSLPTFLKTFEEVVQDDEERGTQTEKEYFVSIQALAEEKYDEKNWDLVFEEEKPIGVLMPQVFPDAENEGTMFYLGLTKENRGKGYGKEIHVEGLNRLYKRGVTDYIGSTLKSNVSMNKVFEANKCELETTQNFYK
jgi:hypothetical protein